MNVLLLHSGNYKIGAIGDSNSCESIDFIMSLNSGYRSSATGLFQLLERVSNEGLSNLSTKLSHLVDKDEKIYEFINGDIRLFYFKTDDDFLVICTTALIKKTQGVDEKHVNKAIKFKQNYLSAVRHNTLNII